MVKNHKKQRQYKKPLRRISIVVTPQTEWHLNRLCAMNGWGEKDKGRVVDKLVTLHQAAIGGKMNTEKRNTAAPAEENLENIKIGTIVKIMRKFNISYGQYIKTRAYWQQKYTESGGILL